MKAGISRHKHNSHSKAVDISCQTILNFTFIIFLGIDTREDTHEKTTSSKTEKRAVLGLKNSICIGHFL